MVKDIGIEIEPESLRPLVRDSPQPDEEALVGYLKSGAVLAVAPGIVFDVLKDEAGPPILAGPMILTDGVYWWRDDLTYYVERYHVVLPEPFVGHARANGWRAPELSAVERARAAREILGVEED